MARSFENKSKEENVSESKAFSEVNKHNLKDALAHYADLQYRINVLDEKNHITELKELVEKLKPFSNEIMDYALNTKPNPVPVNEPPHIKNSLLFVLLELSRNMNANDVAKFQLRLLEMKMVVAGIIMVENVAPFSDEKMLNVKVIRDNIEMGMLIMKDLLASEDTSVRKKASEILDNNRNFRELYEKKYSSQQQEMEQSYQASSTDKAKTSVFRAKQPPPIVKEDGFSFLTYVSGQVTNHLYDEMGRTLLGEKTVPGEIAKLRTALAKLPAEKTPDNFDTINTIFKEVQSIIKKISLSVPDRDDTIEIFYMQLKEQLTSAKTEKLKKDFLVDLNKMVWNPDLDKLGKGAFGAKVPDNIKDLRNILKENISEDDKFKKVSNIISKIKIERHPELRKLFIDLQNRSQNAGPPQKVFSFVNKDTF